MTKSHKKLKVFRFPLSVFSFYLYLCANRNSELKEKCRSCMVKMHLRESLNG